VRPPRLPRLFWLGAVCYVTITILAATHALDSLDRATYRFTVRHHHATLTAAARHLTDFFSPLADSGFLAVGAATLAWIRRRPSIFITAALFEGVMAALVLSVKVGIARPLPHTPPGGQAEAFPSGHTATFLVCFGVLALIATQPGERSRRVALTSVGVGTVVMAAALVYDAFHWLFDTLGSIALGVALLSLLWAKLPPTRQPRPPTADDA